MTVNDKERVAIFYDKSSAMNAPKPQNVPIFWSDWVFVYIRIGCLNHKKFGYKPVR